MTLSRKCIGAVAAVLLVSGYSSGAVADSAKTSTKNVTAMDAKAFFLQIRPVRPAVTPVADYAVSRNDVRGCPGCQPLLVVGVAF